jgi:hypothetical protein
LVMKTFGALTHYLALPGGYIWSEARLASAILGVLAAILLVTLSRAKQKAIHVTRSDNEKQVPSGLALSAEGGRGA